MNISTAKKDIYIDASTLSSSARCFLKMKYRVVDGYTGLSRDHKMAYGTAFHKFLKIFYETHDVYAGIQTALDYYQSPDIIVPPKEFRTPEHLAKTCLEYSVQYANDPLIPMKNPFGDGLMLEQKWVTPQPFYADSSYNFFLFGMIDMFATLGGQPVMPDHKSTSAKIQDYFQTHRLAPQMRMYKLGTRILEETFGDIGLHDVQPMINGVFISQKNPAFFMRSEIMTISEEDLDEFKIMLGDMLEKFSFYLQYQHLVRQGILNGACRDEFFKLCPFFNVCDAPDGESGRQTLLETNYQKRPYNPDIFEQE